MDPLLRTPEGVCPCEGGEPFKDLDARLSLPSKIVVKGTSGMAELLYTVSQQSSVNHYGFCQCPSVTAIPFHKKEHLNILLLT